MSNEDLVWTLVHKYAPSERDSEDLFQEAMLALWKAEQTFDPAHGVKFTTYASRVIENRLIDVIRMKKPEVTLPELPESPEPPASWDDEREILNDVLQDCTALERKIFVSYFHGFSYKEICDQFGVNNKKVDNTIQKIKKMVKLSDEN